MTAVHLQVCPVCGKEGTLVPKSKPHAYVVRGESYAVQTDYFECGHCTETFMPPEGDIGLRRAWEAYRQKHGMVQPKELTAWRNKMGLEQCVLAAVLGWSTTLVQRYEGGKLQTPEHDQQLKLAMRSLDDLLTLVAQTKGLVLETRMQLAAQLRQRNALAGNK